MGTFSIKKVFDNTTKHFPTRFMTRRRDVLKRITVKEVREIERHDVGPDQPRDRIKYIITSYSYPNYPPYFTKKDSKGRTRTYQRRIKHEYDVTLEMDELTLTTKNWRMKLGSMAQWVENPPQNQIKKLYNETKKRFRKKADRRAKTQKEANKLYKQMVEKHKKRAPYLDEGDFNSRTKGINADFIFRDAYAFWKYGHLYGRNYYGNVPSTQTNPNFIPFFPKHCINVLETLMNSGVLQ